MRTSYIFPVLFLIGLVTNLLAGPVAEVEQEHIFVHIMARDFLPQEVLGRATISSAGMTPRGMENPNQSWYRDRFPMQTRTKDGQSMVIGYLSLLNNDGRPFWGSYYLPVSPPAGMSRNPMAWKTINGFVWSETRVCPLLLEGGNLLPMNNHLFVGKKVFESNNRSIEDLSRECSGRIDRRKLRNLLSGLRQSGYRRRSQQEVIEELAQCFELPPENVIYCHGCPERELAMWICS